MVYDCVLKGVSQSSISNKGLQLCFQQMEKGKSHFKVDPASAIQQKCGPLAKRLKERGYLKVALLRVCVLRSILKGCLKPQAPTFLSVAGASQMPITGRALSRMNSSSVDLWSCASVKQGRMFW